MKGKVIITAVLIAVILVGGVFLVKGESTKTEYLRIHIRANSNDAADQNVKYKVKTAVVEYLTPFIAECKTKEQAKKTIESQLIDIEKTADKVLKANGYSYTAKAKVCNEEFPTRTYDDLTLESGYYDALIIGLGEAEGDNWWCVVYPPLCFVGSGTNYVYKSKIKEIIDAFFASHG